MNNNAINILLNCLMCEKSLYEQYYDLSCQKKDAIMSSDISQLDALLEQEQKLSAKVAALEEKRRSIILSITDNESITISEIIEIVENEKQKQQLLELMQDFQKTMEKNKHINDINHELIKSNLNYIRYMLNTVLEEENTYGHNGMENSGTQKLNIFDQRV